MLHVILSVVHVNLIQENRILDKSNATPNKIIHRQTKTNTTLSNYHNELKTEVMLNKNYNAYTFRFLIPPYQQQ